MIIIEYVLLAIWIVLSIVGIVQILYTNCSDYVRVENYYRQKELERKGIKKKTKFIM